MHPIMGVDILIIQPVIALIFGVLILFVPRALNYLVAIYLILIGLIGLWPHLFGAPPPGTTV
ncbi:MAG TPA: DUF3096 domain-containing protein [Rhizomicrobium sp.]|nr:DUF3096 domain-containing protein [Rhizomicrobium sp.]